MRRAYIQTILLVVTSLALTPVQSDTPTPGPAIPACSLDAGIGMIFHEPTVDEMVAPGSTVLAGYDNLKADLLAGLREVYPETAGVELITPSGADAPCWTVLARDGLRRVLWAVGEDGDWMEWPVYYVKGADGKFSLATEVNGQPITYKPVPGSENAHGTFEGDRESGKVLPILARQAVPTTDKGAVYSQFADMMKEEIEWKTVKDIGKVTTLPEGVKDLQTAIDTGWEWGDEKWEQHIVRNEKGEILLDDGISVKLTKVEKVARNGTYTFEEVDGKLPSSKKFSFFPIPEGYEYTVFTFWASNTTKTTEYGDPKNILFRTTNNSTETVKTNYIRSTNADKYKILVIAIQNKKGDSITEVGLAKKGRSVYHKVFDIDDPEFSDLLKN